METKQLVTQGDVEEWLRAKVDVTAVDPLHVRVRPSVEPSFILDEHPEELSEADKHGYVNGQWWYLDAYVTVEMFLPPRGSWLVLAHAVRKHVSEGKRGDSPILMAWEDMADMWKDLACTAVNEAEQTLGTLRQIALAWEEPTATAAAPETEPSSS